MRQVYWDMDDILRRLRRIEGQVRGVQAMVQREESCQAILTQVAAVEGAVKQVSRIVSACSVAEHVTELSNATVDTEHMKNAIKDLIRYG